VKIYLFTELAHSVFKWGIHILHSWNRIPPFFLFAPERSRRRVAQDINHYKYVHEVKLAATVQLLSTPLRTVFVRAEGARPLEQGKLCLSTGCSSQPYHTV
jgi:hypothetical protein